MVAHLWQAGDQIMQMLVYWFQVVGGVVFEGCLAGCNVHNLCGVLHGM
jgi:hypothetical protein